MSLDFLNWTRKYDWGEISNVSSNILNMGGKLMGLFGSSSNSAAKSFEYSKALQQHQYELERQSRKTYYQDARSSLEAANYNPLLAVTGGSSAASLPVGNQMSVTDPKTERLQNGLALANAIADINLKKAQAKNVNTDTDLKPYDKPLKIIGDLLQGKHSKVANSAKNVIGTISSFNSAKNSFDNFKSSHPTMRRVYHKLRHGDFRGVGYEVGYYYGNKFHKSHSAKSSVRPREVSPEDWYDGEPVVGRW